MARPCSTVDRLSARPFFGDSRAPRGSLTVAPLLIASVALPSCLSQSDRVLERRLPDPPAEEAILTTGDAGSPVGGESVSPDSELGQALLGVEPSRGPFSGEQTAVLRGRGFTSEVRVWFGSEELSTDRIIALGPQRVQIQVPPGAAGMVDVATQIGTDASSRRSLPEGYTYESFYLSPSFGPLNGGTLVTLVGDSNDWTEATSVTIDGATCEFVELRQSSEAIQELDCRTPPGTAGRKVVSVEASSGERESVNSAFQYLDSAAELEGSLSGEPLDGEFEVRVLNSLTAEELEGALVVLDAPVNESVAGEPSASHTQRTDSDGRAVFQDAGLNGPVSVTVAMRCMNPITLIDVPVSQATIFVEPVISLDCIPPDPELPTSRGTSAPQRRTLNGELAFGFGVEFKRGGWINVPAPELPGEIQTAYVGELSSSSRAQFQLPSTIRATTPQDGGTLGYNFSYDTSSTGNVTLYALAGLENRESDRKFTPYVMGVLKGVSPVDNDERLFIPMNITLDHSLELQVQAPAATQRGPDRVNIGVSLQLGRSGFLPLPNLQRDALLPLGSPIRFVGVPQLFGPLQGAEYVASVRAVSGTEAEFPWSQLESLATRSADPVLSAGDFVPVPVMVEPTSNGLWAGDRLAVEFAEGQSSVDLLRFRLVSAAGTVSWTVIAPGDRRALALPELPADSGLPPGRISVQVSAARIVDFNYAGLKERHFGSGSWGAFAHDEIPAILR